MKKLLSSALLLLAKDAVHGIIRLNKQSQPPRIPTAEGARRLHTRDFLPNKSED